MSLKIKKILKNGDICEILSAKGKTFSLYIEGKLYGVLPNDNIHEIEEIEQSILSILRPKHLGISLEIWRYATENTWTSFKKMYDLTEIYNK
ncbi:hypothetical protein FC961_12115 [Clostridium botulinum]|nr:hypothetical protein [Clostridium botulinum]NFO92663.1 hypothetical protein [Clostridium botulinum]